MCQIIIEMDALFLLFPESSSVDTVIKKMFIFSHKHVHYDWYWQFVTEWSITRNPAKDFESMEHAW